MVQIVQDKVAIVLGAGASKEFGLPTGGELSAQIIELLKTRTDHFRSWFVDSEFDRAIEVAIRDRVTSGGKQSLIKAARLLEENLSIAPSIDNFLHTHRSNTDIVWLGKLAIVFCLLRAEYRSILKVDPSNIHNRLNLKKCAETWVGRLFTQLAVAGDFEAFVDRLRKIYFVSFNYDRCVQQFMSCAARQYFDLSETQVSSLLSNLNVHYIYGNIGPFIAKSAIDTSFGSNPSAENCIGLIPELQTFTEGQDSNDQRVLDAYLNNSREIYFLGFGFNKLNLDRILPTSGLCADSIFSTTKGVPETAVSQIREELDGRIGKFLIDAKDARVRYDSARALFKNVSCGELIWECQRNFQTSP
ncbi:MAG: hypothetical protein U1E58_00065 [Tabrizicola sp.]